MRRLLIALAAFAIFVAAGLAGLVVSSRLAPERVRAALEQALAREVGPVAIGSVRPFFGWGVGIELGDLRVLEAAEGSALEADRVWITVSPRSLLRGELRARRVELRGLRLDARRGADGSLEPAVLERLRNRSRPGSDATAPPTLRTIASELPALSIEDTVLRVRRDDGAALGVKLFHLALAHDPLGGPPELRAAGRIDRPGADVAEHGGSRDLGSFEIDAVLDDPQPRGSIAVTELDVAAIDPAWIGARDLSGRLTGVATWTPAESGGALELEILGSELRAARSHDAAAVATLPRTRLRAHVAFAPSRVDVTELEWTAGAQKIAGRGSVARPITAATTLRGELRGDSLALAEIRPWILLALPPGGDAERNVAALHAGQVKSLSIRADGFPIGRLSARGEPKDAKDAKDSKQAKPRDAALELTSWLRGLAIETTLDGVELRLGRNEPIRALSGTFAIEAEKLRIEDARAKIGDRPLPGLTLVVDGLGAAIEALRHGKVPPAVPALPGRIALDRWIDSKKRAGAPPRWRRIDVRADWVEHPVLLRALEEVTATLSPANPGVHIRDAKGFWGGVPFSGTGSFYGGPRARIEVRVAMSTPRRTGRRRGDSETWGRVRFHADLEKLGDFQAESLDGVAQAIGDRVELRRGEARLRPRGDLSGSVDLDLSRADSVPYRAKIELAGGSLSDLMYDVKMDGAAARGTAAIDADLGGELRLDVPLLGAMGGTANIRLRDGEINKRMNVLFSLAQVTDTLNPFRSRETIPYEEIDAPLKLGGGVARTEAFALQGPALRMVGTGQVDLVNEPHTTEAVVGVFFFRSLDRVIGIFPLLNRMLLGPDDNLVSTYFAVSGPWADPEASLIPTKSFAAGPASFVLEGLPAFVRGGLSTLERVLTRAPSRPAPAPDAAPPATSAPPAGGPS